MSIEPIGVIIFLLGLVALLGRPILVVYVFLISTLLGAAAAVVLTSFGSISIQPAHFLLGFLALSLVVRRGYLRVALRSLAVGKPGFWLLLTVVVTIFSAIFLPRLFAGATYVFSVARGELGEDGIVLLPLSPVSGNITQAIYFIGDFVCFVALYAYASTGPGMKAIGQAVFVAAVANILFAVLDLATYYTGTGSLLAFIRNATYRMLIDVEVNGMKRIVGSFPEASSFAYATLGYFAFTFRAWLDGVYPRLTGAIALTSLCLLGLSTSSTAYGGLATFLTLQWMSSLVLFLSGGVTRTRFAFLALAPVFGFALAIGLLMNSAAWHAIQDLMQSTLVEKLSSDSGVERSAWNRQAITNFIDTFGLGTGVGSTRASSFLLAVPANIGILGALTYATFLISALFRRGGASRGDPTIVFVRSASRSACLAQLIATSVTGSFIDLGLSFFAFAAFACAPLSATEGATNSAVSSERISSRALPALRQTLLPAGRVQRTQS